MSLYSGWYLYRSPLQYCFVWWVRCTCPWKLNLCIFDLMSSCLSGWDCCVYIDWSFNFQFLYWLYFFLVLVGSFSSFTWLTCPPGSLRTYFFCFDFQCGCCSRIQLGIHLGLESLWWDFWSVKCPSLSDFHRTVWILGWILLLHRWKWLRGFAFGSINWVGMRSFFGTLGWIQGSTKIYL